VLLRSSSSREFSFFPVEDTPAATDEAIASDYELMQDLASGREAGVSAFYDRFASPLFSMACRIAGDRKVAERALEDAFVQVREEASAFDPANSSVFAWAVMIVRSYAVGSLRRSRQVSFRKSHTGAAGSVNLEWQSEASPGAPLEGTKGGHVRVALAMLSPEEREILELAFFEGMSPIEVSDALTLPVITVKARIRSSLLCLREALAASAREPHLQSCVQVSSDPEPSSLADVGGMELGSC